MRPLITGISTAGLALALGVSAQHGTYEPDVKPANDGPQKSLATFQPAEGLQIELVAAEPHLANPVAFGIDDIGRFYVVETHRLRAGVIDMRDHRGWLHEDLACLTVEDRVKAIKKHFGNELDKWRADHERVRCLIDDDGDGKVDRSVVYADGFNDLAAGIAAGFLVDGKDAWFTSIPTVWRLRDEDQDGQADSRQALHNGYGVHFSLIGHDMHGLRIGPDRRLYFSIGDRGFHVEHEGTTHAYPHEGAVLRCELDGSNLEVVHRGLRNPQELAFDEFGNLFTCDNNSDGGDQARWVYIVEGGDSGWAIGFQWLGNRGAWNEEKMWLPAHDMRPSWIVPPIVNVSSGPSGLTYDPGTGLPAKYRGAFLLCDFRGNAARSGIYAIKLKPKGASFEMASKENLVWRMLATDVEFGPDGNVYATDWVQGWGKTGRGRLWRVTTPGEADEAAARTRTILKEGMASRSIEELTDFLTNADQRVRQKAQFALVDRGAQDALLKTAQSSVATTVTRLHGLWGLAIIARQGGSSTEALAAFLRDDDAEIRAQAARILGELEAKAHTDSIIGLLADAEPRPRFFAAVALGRLGAKQAAAPLVKMLEENAGKDAYLEHAAVMGLTGTRNTEVVVAAADHESRHVRLAALLTMRRWQHPAIANFLQDSDPKLVLEAARAIYGLGMESVMPALADLSKNTAEQNVPLLRRILNTRRMLGRPADAKALATYAAAPDAVEAMRVEALQILAEWATPKWQDRVLGNYRELPMRDGMAARTAVAAAFDRLVQGPDRVGEAACQAAAQLGVAECRDALAAIVSSAQRGGATRNAALRALEPIAAKSDLLKNAAASVTADAPVELRKTAIRVLAQFSPEDTVPVLATLVEKASPGERQNAINTLAQLDVDPARVVVNAWLDKLLAGDPSTGPIQVELLDAARKVNPAALAKFEAQAAASGDPLARHRPSLVGGDVRRGRKIVFEKTEAMCIRCHTVGNKGGNAGPNLNGIGKKHDREYLLAALVAPNRDIAEGYEMVVITKKDGTVVAGAVSEKDGQVKVIDPAGNETKFPSSEVASRQGTGGSAMPPIGLTLTPRELRDVIEFLTSKK